MPRANSVGTPPATPDVRPAFDRHALKHLAVSTRCRLHGTTASLLAQHLTQPLRGCAVDTHRSLPQVTVRGVRCLDFAEEPTSASAKPFLTVMDMVGFNYETEWYVAEDEATFEHGRVDGAGMITPRHARGAYLFLWR